MLNNLLHKLHNRKLSMLKIERRDLLKKKLNVRLRIKKLRLKKKLPKTKLLRKMKQLIKKS